MAGRPGWHRRWQAAVRYRIPSPRLGTRTHSARDLRGAGTVRTSALSERARAGDTRWWAVRPGPAGHPLVAGRAVPAPTEGEVRLLAGAGRRAQGEGGGEPADGFDRCQPRVCD